MVGSGVFMWERNSDIFFEKKSIMGFMISKIKKRNQKPEEFNHNQAQNANV